ncbi:MlaD family protein [Sphingomonas flavalba]|uniref:MlaD family protein n=1 Tax=Sphingomonas flavalba TaxID=2559804 RepID=UPI00109DB5E2|nr:MlaD family protein [Sphingomonas flavalba]
METRSNHVLVGVVVLALLAALLVFTVWLARVSGGSEKEYDVFFKQAVDGIAKGSSVTFSGVPSGQVKEIALWRNDPQFVRVRISVKEETPILQGTTATIEGVGFTGVSQIQLDGAIKGAPPITDLGPGGVPVIPTKPGALGELLNSAPKLLERLTTLTERLTELLGDKNQASIAGILANVERLSDALADRGPEIAATLAQTRIAIQQAGDAAEEIGKLAGTSNALIANDAKPLLAELRRTVKAAGQSMETLDATIKQAQPGVRAFSNQTIPEAGLLIRDLREMAESLNAVAERVNHGGAGSLVGSRKLPDYKGPKK